MGATIWTPSNAINGNANVWEPGSPPPGGPLVEWQQKGGGYFSLSTPYSWETTASGILFGGSNFSTINTSDIWLWMEKRLVERVDPPTDKAIVTNVLDPSTTAPLTIWTPGVGGETFNYAPIITYHGSGSSNGVWTIRLPTTNSAANLWTGGILQIYTNNLRLVINYLKASYGNISITWEYQWV